MSIRKKFIVFSILWGIIPAIIATSICISNFNARNTEIITQNVETFSKDQAIHLKAFFDDNISNLNSDTNIPAVRDLLIDSNNKRDTGNKKRNMQLLNGILANRKHEQFFLSKEVLVDKDGIVVASGDNDYINEKIWLSNEEMERLAQNKVVVTDVIENKDFNNGIKSTIIANPIFWDNEYQGFIANVINMNYFEKLVNDVNFFDTGKIVVMDKNGVVAASTSKDITESISKINSANNLYEQWQKIDFDSNPDGAIEYKINGVEKTGYYSGIGNTGWVVLSGIEWAEFKTPIDKTIKTATIFVILISLLIITSYTFTINYFSKPIYKLLKAIRKVKQGSLKDRFIYNEDNEFGEIATAFNDLIDAIEQNRKHIEDKNRKLQSLTSNIPGGVYTCRIEDGEYVLDFASRGCLYILGYEKHELKEIFNRKFIDLIYEADRERVVNEIKEQLDKHNKYNVEYRVKRKDGSIVWLLDNGQVVKDREGKSFTYNVVINITKSKMFQEELRLSEERYSIIMSQTEDAIFEWNIQKDTVSFSGNWKNKFSYESVVNNISEIIYKTDYIYKDDIKKFGKLLNDIVYGDTYKETEIRIKKNTNEYIWCKIRITAMFDENGNIFKAIGIIIDIDEEKKEAEKLLFKAQRDSLTSLYNKGTAQSMIEEYIESAGEDVNGALFVIDLDNFKAVNDNLGHLAGDFVLTTISSVLSEIFQEDSIVGRIGGDEFVIFLKNVDSEELIRKKEEELMKGFRSSFEGEISDYKVSGSIGIAKYPKHGKCFKQLFINADKAVYLAKSKGKDNYCIFEED
jgi:diguanylate cyclase (GGDEF)-like protein/PAS domain S-box-containing protein